MKSVIKIISYVLLSIIGLVGVVFGYAYISGSLGENRVFITELTFAESDKLVIDDFSTKLNFFPLDATDKDIVLNVDFGSDVVSVPQSVVAGEEFEITLKKDENGNNIGGKVVISARSKEFGVVSEEKLEFWVDIAIPNDGLLIESSITGNEVSAGGGEFYVYVFTNPRHAIFPNKSDDPNETTFLNNQYTYKNIELKSSNPNAIKILGQGVLGSGYYNANHKQNNSQPVFYTTRPAGMPQLQRTRFVRYVAQPGVSSQGAEVVLSSKSLRTYFMQQDFVDVNSYSNENQAQAFIDFSNYIEKYRHYIETDAREFKRLNDEGQLVTIYENGAEFLEAVTREGQGVIIGQTNTIFYDAAMYYLYVDNEISFNILDVNLREIEVKPAEKDSEGRTPTEFNMLENRVYDLEQFASAFGLHLVPDNEEVNQDVLKNKIANIKIKPVMGQKLTPGHEDYVEGKITLEEEKDASEYISIQNPTVGLSPMWSINALQPTAESGEDFIGLKFYIEEDGVEFYSLVELFVDVIVPSNLTLNREKIPTTFAINGLAEDKSIFLNSDLYEINENATYSTVKFFIMEQGAKNASGKFIFQIGDVLDNNIQPQTIIEEGPNGNSYSVFEITYAQLNALNVGSGVRFFAAVVKTDVDGQPILVDENNPGSYIIIEKSPQEEIEIDVISYIDNIYFYTFETEMHEDEQEEESIVRTNLLNRNNYTSRIQFLYGQTYQLILSNSYLDADGNFDSDMYLNKNPENIDHAANELYALKKAFENNYLEINITSPHSHNLLEVDLSGTQYFEYDEENNYLILTLITLKPETNLSVDHSYEFTIVAGYKDEPIPSQMLGSSVATSVEFASIDDDLWLGYEIARDGSTWYYTSSKYSEVEITASDTADKVQWRLEDGYPFESVAVFYDFDIENTEIETPETDDQEAVYRYTSNKLDISHRNKEFVENYASLLRNNEVEITIESNKPEYATVTRLSDDIYIVNIIKGESNGEVVELTTTVTLYGIQTKTATLKLKLFQEEPQSFFYSERTLNDEYIQVPDGTGDYNFNNGIYEESDNGNYIRLGDHYIVNSETNPQIMEAGHSRDLIYKVQEGQGLRVYSYNLISDGTAENKEIIGSGRGLLDVRFEGSEGSIIGDVKFEIRQKDGGNPPIYFLLENEQGELVKSYTAYATKDLFNPDDNYKLMVYTDSVADNANVIIDVSSPLFGSYPYHIQVQNNLTFTTPTSRTETSVDNENNGEVNLSEKFSVVQEVGLGSYLNLPISFEFGSATPWGEMHQANSDFDVAQNLKSNIGYILKEGSLDEVVTERFCTKFTPYFALENKDIPLRMFYYIPKIDNYGNFVYVATSTELAGKIIYEHNDNLGTYYYLDTEINDDGEEVEVKVEYTGELQFLFEKKLFENTIGSIRVLPTIDILTGENLQQPIEIKSGTEVDLYNINISFDSTNRIGTTNFIDILKLTQNNPELILPQDILDYSNVDYSEIYNKYITLQIKQDDYTVGTPEYQTFIDLGLGTTLQNGMLTSKTINRDLLVTILVNVFEGQLYSNQYTTQNHNKSFEISVLFKNSVEFNITSNYENYITDINNPTTHQIIGHIYKGLGSVETDPETNHKSLAFGKEKEIELYSNANDIQNNIVNILGGNNENLLSEFLESAVLYVYDGYEFVEYSDIVKVVEEKNTAGEVSRIYVLISSISNDNQHFMIKFNTKDFEIEGGSVYYFSVVSDVVLQADYPVFSNHEVVQNGTEINLHGSYINPNSRIAIKIKSYTPANEKQGSYKKVNNNLFAYVGQNKGDYDVVLTEYVFENQNGLVLKDTSSENSISIIQTESLDNWFEYSLLNQNKQKVSSINEIRVDGVARQFPFYASNYDNGKFSFSNIVSSKTIYVRVAILNTVYVDYRVDLKTTSNAQQFSFVNREEAKNITEHTPLLITAESQEFNIYDYIMMQHGGFHSDLLITYNSFGANSPVAQLKIGNDGLFNIINEYEYIPTDSVIKFADIASPQTVEFVVYGNNFTSGMEAKIFYIRVLPNFKAVAQEQIPAGIKISLDKILELEGNSEGAEIEIININNLGYDKENKNLFYNAELDIVYDEDNNVNLTESYFVIDDLSFDIVMELGIRKIFNQNEELYITTKITIKPNVLFSNSNNQSFEIIAPLAGEIQKFFEEGENNQNELMFASSMLTNERLVANENVEFYYSVLTPNLVDVGTDNNDLLELGIADFDATTGNFTILSVNSEKNFVIRLTIRWLRRSDKEQDYNSPIVHHHDYSVKIVPQILDSEFKITYSNPTIKEVLVFEGSVVELVFDNTRRDLLNEEREYFAAQGQNYVDIQANQITDIGVKFPVNIVMLEEETSAYRLYSETEEIVVEEETQYITKYYIEFKGLATGSQVVSIKVYYDLTKNKLGLVNNVEGLYTEQNSFITFSIQPALNSISLNTQGQEPNSQSNPHIINTENMRFVDYGEGNGDFNFIIDIDEDLVYYSYVGNNNGRYRLKESVFDYIEVDEGEGDFNSVTEYDFQYYEYVGEGNGNFILQEGEPKYVYVGNSLGKYNKIDDNFELGENGVGDYVLLGKAQVDLFELISKSLFTGNNLTFDNPQPQDSDNTIYIKEYLLRNSVSFVVNNNKDSVYINHGIAEFAPRSTDLNISITAKLYGLESKSVTIWFKVGAGAVITPIAIDDNAISVNNPLEFVIENTENNATLNIADYVFYGYSLIIEEGVEYGVEEPTIPEDPDEENGENEVDYINKDGDIIYIENTTLIKRGDVFLPAINLNKSLLRYSVNMPQYINSIQNGVVEFKSFNEIQTMFSQMGVNEIIIEFNVQIPNSSQSEDSTNIYVKIVLAD